MTTACALAHCALRKRGQWRWASQLESFKGNAVISYIISIYLVTSVYI